MSHQQKNVWTKKPPPVPSKSSVSQVSSSLPAKMPSKIKVESAGSSGYSNLKLFGEISKQHQEGIAAKLSQLKNSFGDEADSDEEVNIPNKDEIVQNILNTYNNLAGGDAEKVRHSIVNATSAGAATCLICISSLKRADPVWNCDSCSSVFHLGCIQRWAKDGIIITSDVLSDKHFPNKDRFWACPKCRFEYKVQDAPTQYWCYCKKVRDPVNDPWILPHSCGQICEKTLKSGCAHKCCLLCHPGPCPPCPAQSKVFCFCGKLQKVVRCGIHSFTCSRPCGKRLDCLNHNCVMECHDGDCAPCTKQTTISCACGSESSSQLCGVKVYHCKRVCGKLFGCIIHKCVQVCHSGECGPCPRSLPRSCPCGRTRAVADCLVEVTPCDNVCGKPVCGLHSCQELCHYGDCGKCVVPVKKTCPCGAKNKTAPCSADITCDIKCKKLRNCQRHTCNKRCCAGLCPPCDQVCGRVLPCKTHKCESLCHPGQCYPCIQMVELSCNCGAAKITVPCGRQRSIKPPKCNIQCRELPDCHHKERIKHPCHFGKCPPCSQICLQNLPCDHRCQAKCHSAVEMLVEHAEPVGPWEVKKDPEREVRKLPCPPCQHIVSMPCLGQHDEAPMKCFEKRVVSCGRLCGRKLACGNHSCNLPCHAPEEGCEDCNSACARRLLCQKHDCYLPCHHGDCPSCAEIVKMSCYCKSMGLKFSCGKFAGMSDEEKRTALSCKTQCHSLISCGHQCRKLCHPESELHSLSKECRQKVIQKCPCGRMKQQKICSEITATFPCNAECLAIVDAKKEEEARVAQEAVDNKDKASREEQEKYDSRMQGKKRRRYRNEDPGDQESFFARNKKIMLTGIVFVLVIAVLIHFLHVT